MDICLIQVPYTMGDERQGSSKGPECLVQAGANKLIAAKGLTVTVERGDRGEPFRDSGNASLNCKQATRGDCQAGDCGQTASLGTRWRLRCQQGHTFGLRPWAVRRRLVRCACRF